MVRAKLRRDMARDADFDLAVALRRPGFTPGQRDIPALIAMIVADEAAAVRAMPALAGLGARVAIAAAVATAEDGGAARLVATLGLVARAGDTEARALLIGLVTDARSRVRRAAIVALGKLGATREADDVLADARAALVARWDAGDAAPDEQRALAEALGKIGGDGVRERLTAIDARADKELARRRDRALLVTDREAQRGADSEVRTDLAPPSPLVVRLGCRPALAELLIAELRSVGLAGSAVRDDSVDVQLTGPWSTLFASRLWATAAVRVDVPALRAARGDRARVTATIVDAVTSARVRGLMEAWTTGPIRWRLALARGHQRAVVWTVANEVTRRAPSLINDPTQTTWDVRVDDEEGTLELVPRRYTDPRFAYRVAEVPAASHPSVAAAVVWLAGLGRNERAWDPFCGSGLEVIEAARRGARAIGSDLDGDALAAARENAAAAQVTLELASGDARSYRPGSVDAIVTNPPLGSRVHVDAGALLAESLPHFARTLRVGGRLVWITPQWRRTTPVAEECNLVLVRSLFVDLGGVRGRLERWDRKR